MTRVGIILYISDDTTESWFKAFTIECKPLLQQYGYLGLVENYRNGMIQHHNGLQDQPSLQTLPLSTSHNLHLSSPSSLPIYSRQADL